MRVLNEGTPLCYVCREREALIRLTVRPSLRCFECVADDPELPPGYRYKHVIERGLLELYD